MGYPLQIVESDYMIPSQGHILAIFHPILERHTLNDVLDFLRMSNWIYTIRNTYLIIYLHMLRFNCNVSYLF